MPDPYDGPWGGRNNSDPDSPWRFGLFVLALLAAWFGPLAAFWPASEAVGWTGVAMILWLWLEFRTHDQARRDLLTDLVQNIHDGNIEADDLRRARGYPHIEETLEDSQ